MEPGESENLDLRETLIKLADGLIETVIQVDEHYTPEELKHRMENLRFLKGEIKNAGYDKVRAVIREKLKEDREIAQDRVQHQWEMMTKIVPQRRPNEVEGEIAHWMGRLKSDLPDDLRRNGRLQNAAGVISAWQAEDLEKESQITNFSPSEN